MLYRTVGECVNGKGFFFLTNMERDLDPCQRCGFTRKAHITETIRTWDLERVVFLLVHHFKAEISRAGVLDEADKTFIMDWLHDLRHKGW